MKRPERIPVLPYDPSLPQRFDVERVALMDAIGQWATGGVHHVGGATVRHILIPPYTPHWNGKVERFIQTLKCEWAYAHAWPTSAERARSMPSFLRYYNRRRPHSSLGDRPPISRVHNVRG